MVLIKSGSFTETLLLINISWCHHLKNVSNRLFREKKNRHLFHIIFGLKINWNHYLHFNLLRVWMQLGHGLLRNNRKMNFKLNILFINDFWNASQKKCEIIKFQNADECMHTKLQTDRYGCQWLWLICNDNIAHKKEKINKSHCQLQLLSLYTTSSVRKNKIKIITNILMSNLVSRI